MIFFKKTKRKLTEKLKIWLYKRNMKNINLFFDDKAQKNEEREMYKFVLNLVMKKGEGERDSVKERARHFFENK